MQQPRLRCYKSGRGKDRPFPWLSEVMIGLSVNLYSNRAWASYDGRVRATYYQAVHQASPMLAWEGAF